MKSSSSLSARTAGSLRCLAGALKAAKTRALYWSGNATFVGKRFVPGKRGRKNHALEYEMALDDIENLSTDIEALTGKKIKRYDPRGESVKRWNTMMTRLAERKGRKRPSDPS